MGKKRPFTDLSPSTGENPSKHLKPSEPETNLSAFWKELDTLQQHATDLIANPKLVDPKIQSSAESVLESIAALKNSSKNVDPAPGNPPSNEPSATAVPKESLHNIPCGLESFKGDPHPTYEGYPVPPLPPISDPQLLKACFTHPGTLNNNQSITESYERLEYLGDAYMEAIASQILFDKIPTTHEGKLSTLRETLVRNDTLANYSIQYGFDKRLLVQPSFRRDSKQWTKILGDVMEAYVGAMVLDDSENGVYTAASWLAALWGPKLAAIDPKCSAPDASYKEELQRTLATVGVQLSYRDIPPLSKEYTWSQAVYFNGMGHHDLFLGHGSGNTKKQASFAAAADALSNNLVLVMELNAKKRESDAKRKAERGNAAAVKR